MFFVRSLVDCDLVASGGGEVGEDGADAGLQLRYFTDGIPHDFQIHAVVLVGEDVAHAVVVFEGHGVVLQGQIGGDFQNFAGGLADVFEGARDGVMGAGVVFKLLLREAGRPGGEST